jgi:hypothetical protein
MIGHVGLHRTDHANVVDGLGGFGKNLADLDAALPVFFEGKRRPEGRAGFAFGIEMNGDFLAVILREFGLRIEGVHVRGAAIHEKVNDALGLGGQRRVLRSQRMEVGGFGGAQAEGIAEEAPEGQTAHAHAATVQEIAAGKQEIFEARSVMRHDGWILPQWEPLCAGKIRGGCSLLIRVRGAPRRLTQTARSYVIQPKALPRGPSLFISQSLRTRCGYRRSQRWKCSWSGPARRRSRKTSCSAR